MAANRFCCAWFGRPRSDGSLSLDKSQKTPLVVREPTKEEKQVAQGHFSKGSSLHSKDELEKAVHHYREAAKFDETRPEILYNLGNALQDLGHLEDAAETYLRVIRLQKDHHAAWYLQPNLKIVMILSNTG